MHVKLTVRYLYAVLVKCCLDFFEQVVSRGNVVGIPDPYESVYLYRAFAVAPHSYNRTGYRLYKRQRIYDISDYPLSLGEVLAVAYRECEVDTTQRALGVVYQLRVRDLAVGINAVLPSKVSSICLRYLVPPAMFSLVS